MTYLAIYAQASEFEAMVIAKQCGIEHDNAYQLLLKYKDKMESELGKVRFEIGASQGPTGQPRAQPLPGVPDGRSRA